MVAPCRRRGVTLRASFSTSSRNIFGFFSHTDLSSRSLSARFLFFFAVDSEQASISRLLACASSVSTPALVLVCILGVLGWYPAWIETSLINDFGIRERIASLVLPLIFLLIPGKSRSSRAFSDLPFSFSNSYCISMDGLEAKWKAGKVEASSKTLSPFSLFSFSFCSLWANFDSYNLGSHRNNGVLIVSSHCSLYFDSFSPMCGDTVANGDGDGRWSFLLYCDFL